MKEDVVRRLDALRRAVEEARSVPMSASVMINRNDFMELLGELESTMEETLSHATEVVGDRDAFVDTGRLEAIEILRQAERQSEDMISATDVFKLAQDRADEVARRAADEAAALRAETDAYVEEKLANFEHTLEKTAERVRVGRTRLARSTEAADPELRVETDEYVDTKLAEFEQTLNGTLDVLRKGRAQLSGGHVHGLGDDTDVHAIVLPDHLER